MGSEQEYLSHSVLGLMNLRDSQCLIHDKQSMNSISDDSDDEERKMRRRSTG